MVGQVDSVNACGEEFGESSGGIVAQIGGPPFFDHPRKADAFALQSRTLVERGMNQLAHVLVDIGAVDAVSILTVPEQDLHRRTLERRGEIRTMFVEVDDVVAAGVLLDQGSHMVNGRGPGD